ncbi:hypothetical protein FWF48_03115 [Candidatus Saccharibacteria bacterium]|nr:hypothetical protein [Candidatus Saccharibacteria bacterium]
MTGAYLITYGYTVLMLLVVIIVAFAIAHAPFIRRFYLPASLVAGLLLLILGPQVAGVYFPDWQLSHVFYDIWQPLPSVLINVVFACLFLGHPLLSLKKIWRLSGAQIAFGQMIAWGQYLMGGLVTLLVLIPLFHVPQITASLLEASFEGGHGTVAGLRAVFSSYNFLSGQAMANGLATASLITALIVGVIIINWGKKQGHLRPASFAMSAKDRFYYYTLVHDIHKKGLVLREKHLTPFKFGRHLLLVGVAIAFGLAIRQILMWIEMPFGIKFFAYMPTFPMCMFGGLIVNYLCMKFKIHISHTANNMISTISLGVLIMTAIGTMSLSFFGDAGGTSTFIILYLTGALWIMFSALFLARKMYKRYWFQNMIISFGQAMGMTATGLLFAQMTDPKNRTSAVDAFGYKQLLFEPFMGGGLITAASIPIIVSIGLPLFTIICGVLTIGWMLAGLFYFGKKQEI